MKSVWTNHIKNEDEKARFQNEILGSRRVLERLVDILDGLEKDLDTAELSTSAYDSPNWAPRQAHVNGMKAALRKTKTLISLDKGEG